MKEMTTKRKPHALKYYSCSCTCGCDCDTKKEAHSSGYSDGRMYGLAGSMEINDDIPPEYCGCSCPEDTVDSTLDVGDQGTRLIKKKGKKK